MTGYNRSLKYKQRIEELVGDKQPIEILSSTISDLKQVLANLEASQLDQIPSGSWSIKDVLQHLVDAEMVNGYRLRMALTAQQPLLPGFNQDLWVQRFNDSRNSTVILEEWQHFRSFNLRLIYTITAEELEKVYVHEERGQETVADLLHLIAGHDLIHLEQIKRLIRQL